MLDIVYYAKYSFQNSEHTSIVVTCNFTSAVSDSTVYSMQSVWFLSCRPFVQSQFLAKWHILLLFFVLPAVYYCFNKYFTLKETHPNDGDIVFTTNFQYYIDLYQTWLVLGTHCLNIMSITYMSVYRPTFMS